MKSLKESVLLNKLWKKYGYNIFLITGLLGMFFIYLSETDYKKDTKTQPADYLGEYKTNMEAEMEELLSSVKGAGKVKVMITLESGQENVYVWQEKTSENRQTVSGDISRQESVHTTYENEIVTIDENGYSQALVEKTLQPAIQGIVVVCQGADDIKVLSDITDAVSVALNVTTNRICVIKMQ